MKKSMVVRAKTFAVFGIAVALIASPGQAFADDWWKQPPPLKPIPKLLLEAINQKSPVIDGPPAIVNSWRLVLPSTTLTEFTPNMFRLDHTSDWLAPLKVEYKVFLIGNGDQLGDLVYENTVRRAPFCLLDSTSGQCNSFLQKDGKSWWPKSDNLKRRLSSR